MLLNVMTEVADEVLHVACPSPPFREPPQKATPELYPLVIEPVVYAIHRVFAKALRKGQNELRDENVIDDDTRATI